MPPPVPEESTRVVSGMRPTGPLHLGHWVGVLQNWVALQKQHDCYFFAADWHALTTHYESPGALADLARGMACEWLAVGVDPERATLFVQSGVPEHAELHLLLSMITPLGWLERVPTYKEQQEALADRDLSTYGFLGYPVLMTADVLAYAARLVPVGQDQVAHLEVTREIARRFNFLYGRGPAFEQLLARAQGRLTPTAKLRWDTLVKEYRESGAASSWNAIESLLGGVPDLKPDEQKALAAEARGTGREILPEPRPLLTPGAKLPGTDGRKMSKSYGNAIGLRDPEPVVREKIRTMVTDPARVRRSDPGDPARCPVWKYHETFSPAATREWAQVGCRSAGIGCLDCKMRLLGHLEERLGPVREQIEHWHSHPRDVEDILQAGCEKAEHEAHKTLAEVRAAVGLADRR